MYACTCVRLPLQPTEIVWSNHFKSGPRFRVELAATMPTLAIHLTSDLAQKNFKLAITSTPTIHAHHRSRLTQIRTHPRIAMCFEFHTALLESRAINVYLSILNRFDDDTMRLNGWCSRSRSPSAWKTLCNIDERCWEYFDVFRCFFCDVCRISHCAVGVLRICACIVVATPWTQWWRFL